MSKKVVVSTVLLALSVGVGVAVSGEPTAKETLGKLIFFDENLSLNSNQSCATCHAPEAGWTGPTSFISKRQNSRICFSLSLPVIVGHLFLWRPLL